MVIYVPILIWQNILNLELVLYDLSFKVLTRQLSITDFFGQKVWSTPVTDRTFYLFIIFVGKCKM
jgi:hypothetical protein